MRNYENELKERVKYISNMVQKSNADGIVFGNSGGKDSALVGILCKTACDNTIGIIMPCASKRNLNEDLQDGMAVADKYSIETKIVDLSPIKAEFLDILGSDFEISDKASSNIPPRLRMTTLYAVGASNNLLVAGTGNRSETYMGYFTKWGDGACDFNPISDLTVTEIYEFLEYLEAPECIIKKAPSAGLFDGQTDESEMGITYKKIDDYIVNGVASEEDKAIIKKYHDSSEHKRKMPAVYGG